MRHRSTYKVVSGFEPEHAVLPAVVGAVGSHRNQLLLSLLIDVAQDANGCEGERGAVLVDDMPSNDASSGEHEVKILQVLTGHDLDRGRWLPRATLTVGECDVTGLGNRHGKSSRCEVRQHVPSGLVGLDGVPPAARFPIGRDHPCSMKRLPRPSVDDPTRDHRGVGSVRAPTGLRRRIPGWLSTTKILGDSLGRDEDTCSRDEKRKQGSAAQSREHRSWGGTPRLLVHPDGCACGHVGRAEHPTLLDRAERIFIYSVSESNGRGFLSSSQCPDTSAPPLRSGQVSGAPHTRSLDRSSTAVH